MPPIVYKFSSARHVAENLRQRRLKVSEKKELNDPFEIRYKGADLDLERASQYFRSPEGRERVLDAFRQRQRPDLAALEAEPTLPEAVVDRLAQQFVHKNAHLQEFMGAELDKALVMSTSSSNSHVLLWSHYADRHRGAAIGLDYSWAREPLIEVAYPEEDDIPVLDVLDHDDWGQAKRVLSTKARAWRYEQEYRAIWQRDQATRDGDLWFISIHPRIVREVVFGCCISQGDRQAILDELSGEDYNHVVTYEATQSGSRYRIEVHPLRPQANT